MLVFHLYTAIYRSKKMFSKNCSCYLNLVFSLFFVVFRTNRKRELKVLFLFSSFSLFLRTENSFHKHKPNNKILVS